MDDKKEMKKIKKMEGMNNKIKMKKDESEKRNESKLLVGMM
jgi:hypothetical protein